jgi:hypothetical protein
MTILYISTVYGVDFYRIDADEDAVRDAVDELEEKYVDQTDWDAYDKEQFILDGLEERGFDVWGISVVTAHCN